MWTEENHKFDETQAVFWKEYSAADYVYVLVYWSKKGEILFTEFYKRF